MSPELLSGACLQGLASNDSQPSRLGAGEIGVEIELPPWALQANNSSAASTVVGFATAIFPALLTAKRLWQG